MLSLLGEDASRTAVVLQRMSSQEGLLTEDGWLTAWYRIYRVVSDQVAPVWDSSMAIIEPKLGQMRVRASMYTLVGKVKHGIKYRKCSNIKSNVGSVHTWNPM